MKADRDSRQARNLGTARPRVITVAAPVGAAVSERRPAADDPRYCILFVGMSRGTVEPEVRYWLDELSTALLRHGGVLRRSAR